MSRRHLCWQLMNNGANGWAICSACDGRVHEDGCTSRKDPNRDCCFKRHKRLHESGQTVGLNDSSVPMFDPGYRTWQSD